MNKYLKFLLPVLLIGLGTAAYIYLVKNQGEDTSAELQRVRKEDLTRLESGEDRPDMIAMSLRRYIIQDVPNKAALVKKYLDHTDENVREAAIELAGSIEGTDFWQSLSKVLQSNNKKLRYAALRGLTRVPGEPRANLVKWHMGKIQDPEEILYSKYILMIVTPDLKEKEKYKNEVLGYVQKNSSPLADEMKIQIFRVFNNDVEVTKLAEQELYAPENPDVSSAALRYTSIHDQAFLTKNINKLSTYPNKSFKRSLLDTITTSCLPGGEAALKIMINEKSQTNLSETEIISKANASPCNFKL